MVDRILRGEKYAEAAALSSLYNLKKRLEQREENSIWGPMKMPPKNRARDTSFGSKPVKDEQKLSHVKRICDQVLRNSGKESFCVTNNTERKLSETHKLMSDEIYVKIDHTADGMLNGVDHDSEKELETDNTISSEEIEIINYNYTCDYLEESGINKLKNQAVETKIFSFDCNVDNFDDVKTRESVSSQFSSRVPDTENPNSLKTETDGHIFSEKPVNSKRELEGYPSEIEVLAAPDIYEVVCDSVKNVPSVQTRILKNSKSHEFTTEVFKKNKRTRNRSGDAVNKIELWNSGINAEHSQLSIQVPNTKYRNIPDMHDDAVNKKEPSWSNGIHAEYSQLSVQVPNTDNRNISYMHDESVEQPNPTLRIINEEIDSSQTKISENNQSNKFKTGNYKNCKRVRNRSGDAVNEKELWNSGIHAEHSQLSIQVPNTANQNISDMLDKSLEQTTPSLRIINKEKDSSQTKISKSNQSSKFETEKCTSKRVRNRSGDVVNKKEPWNSGINAKHSHLSIQVPNAENQNISDMHVDESVEEPNPTLRITSKEKDSSQTKISDNSQSSKFETGKYKKSKSIRNISGAAVSEKKSQNRRKIESQNQSVDKQLFTVKITDKTDKYYEITATSLDISRIKRQYQKLLAILPEVDAGCKKVDFSADVLNMILRYVFNHRRNFDAVSSPVIHIEALAAAEVWEVWDLQRILKENFLQKVLTPLNAKLVYSHACHFDLKEISSVSKSIIEKNMDLNSELFKKRLQSCLVSISTYVEPLEIGIPFQPIEQAFGLSFEKTVINTFIFKAISGCYTITGFQVQLNEQYLKKNEENLKIKIDYSTKNASNSDRCVETKRQEKPLRPINIIYFKKNLIIKPNEIGEITVEIDTKLDLCSAYFKREIPVENDFILKVDSNYKMDNSDTKLFIIAKLFYHVKKV